MPVGVAPRESPRAEKECGVGVCRRGRARSIRKAASETWSRSNGYIGSSAVRCEHNTEAGSAPGIAGMPVGVAPRESLRAEKECRSESRPGSRCGRRRNDGSAAVLNLWWWRTECRSESHPGNRCGRRRNVGSVSAVGGGHGRSEGCVRNSRGRMDEGITAIGRAQTDDCGRTGRNGPKGIRLQVGGARMRAAGLRGGRCRGAVRGACYRASSHPR